MPIGIPNRTQTHCKRGHEFTEENSYWYGPEKLWLMCRQCNRDDKRKRTGATPRKSVPEVADGQTWCTYHQEPHPDAEFYLYHSSAGKPLRPVCRIRARQEYGPGRRLSRYGLSESQFEALWDAQQGCCVICAQPGPSVEVELGPSGGRGKRWWHIDHDHACCDTTPTCGECVRGLLCSHCNRGLGAFSDDEERLLRAVRYLRERRTQSSEVTLEVVQ